MRIVLDKTSYDLGFNDAYHMRQLKCPPGADRLAYLSGVIDGKARRETEEDVEWIFGPEKKEG